MRTIKGSSHGTQAIARAAALLRIVARYGREGARLVDLCRSTDLTQPTIHRILQGLIEEHLVSQDQTSRRYRLGALIFELGLAVQPGTSLIDGFRPHLRRLAEDSGDTVYLVRRSGSDAVCLDRAEGTFPIRTLTLEVGGRRPLGIGAGGVALLANLDDAEIARTLDRNAREKVSGYDVSAAQAAIHSTRAVGYSLSRGAITEGVDGLGMVIPNPIGLPWLAVSIACISSRMLPPRIDQLSRLLRATIGQLPPV
ncbi:MAG TPA: IclR family transcriptional regulator [Aliidongia sp.]|uniref:IclR family transcriptional regulator n=1 Tax=Aliidongia sp. TaxID=1914230 RepID=UPI002DDD0F75|nr:IclR family transcriptional regulator [Aliidongia sp.]HEV2673347.1 IclR family transcriptional regulator [Aliidongia sp.]